MGQYYKFVNLTRKQESDIPFKNISQIIVQIYSQTRNSNLKSDCLNLIDYLYQFNVYGLEQATKEYDTRGDFP